MNHQPVCRETVLRPVTKQHALDDAGGGLFGHVLTRMWIMWYGVDVHSILAHVDMNLIYAREIPCCAPQSWLLVLCPMGK